MLILSSEELQKRLAGLLGWRLDGHVLKKEYEFPSFSDAMIFVNELAQNAADADYYPASLEIKGKAVALVLISPEGFIKEKDFVLAETAEKAAAAALNAPID